MKQPWDINKTAKFLGVVRRTIYYWIKAGTAPEFERVCGRYLFVPDSVIKFKKNMDKK